MRCTSPRPLAPRGWWASHALGHAWVGVARAARVRQPKNKTHDPPSRSSQIRKLPVLHQPWLHVAWALGGAAAATSLVEWTDKAHAEMEADVARRAAAMRSAGR